MYKNEETEEEGRKECLQERKERSPPIFRKDKHLSTALTLSEIDYFMLHRSNPKALKQEHRALAQAINNIHLMHPDWFFPSLLKSLLIPREVRSLSSFKESLLSDLHTSLVAANWGIKDWSRSPLKVTIPSDLPTLLVTVYKFKREMTELFSQITFQTEPVQKYETTLISGTTYGENHLIQLDGSNFLVSHAHVAGARDLLCAWFSCLLYAWLYAEKYPEKAFYEEVERVLLNGAALIISEGQNGYAVMKSMGSIVIGSILSRQENSPTFLNETLAGLGRLANTPFVTNLIKPFNDDVDVMLRLELTGLAKCFGHPNILMDSSCASWREKASCAKPDVGKIGCQLTNVFKMTFCRQYYSRHKKWPPLEKKGPLSPRVDRAIVTNTWTEGGGTSLWEPDEFQNVELGKVFDFDYFVDPADLLADKAIIPAKDQWPYEYDKQAFRTHHGRFPTSAPKTEGRVILDYLTRNDLDLRDILQTVSTGQIPENWRVMVAVPKEREFKRENARFYAKMCNEMRLYQTATEANIAEQVFPYIKQQSMTMSEEELLRTIIKLNSQRPNPDGVSHVFITVDFSSWCTNFRYELATPIFKMLDKMFGLKGIYAFTHLFPLQSHILFQDRYFPPDQLPDGSPRPGPRCMFGSEAWLEGLRQKGWTLITILLILWAASKMNTVASLLGQGDNQVIYLRIPSPDYLRSREMTKDQYVAEFMRELHRLADAAGIPIKLEESWISNNLFEYSRRYFYKGAQASCALKRISRVASEANQTIPTLNGDISGIFSSGTAAAAEDPLPCSSYIVSAVEALLRIEETFPWIKNQPHEHKAMFLSVTRTLGGLPISIYPQFCARAVQDPLSTGISLLKTIYKDTAARNYILCVATLRCKNQVNYESLVKDPSSLPLYLPTQSESFIRSEVDKGLTQYITNKKVLELFTSADEASKQSFIATLMDIKPIHPKLMNHLYGLSLFGMQEKMAGKFASTRSIMKVAFKEWSSELEVLNRVRVYEDALSLYYHSRLPSPFVFETLFLDVCPTKSAQLLRETMWKIRVTGITMAPAQCQARLVKWEEIPPEWVSRSILYIVKDTVLDDNYDWTRGSCSIYVGSATGLRAKKAPLQVVESTQLHKALLALVTLMPWVKGDQGLTDLFVQLIKEKTDVSIEELTRYAQQIYSGSLTHRLPTTSLRRGAMINQNMTFSSHIVKISDTATMFSKKGENYTICYQTLFLSAVSQLRHLCLFGTLQMPGQWGQVLECPSCTYLIPEERFELGTCNYVAVNTPYKIVDITPRIPQIISSVQGVGGKIGYSVYMAHKFTSWSWSQMTEDRLTQLEVLSHSDFSTPGFVNLTELKHLDISAFFASFVIYLAIYNRSFMYTYDVPLALLEATSRHKTTYDMIFDSIAKCGLLDSMVAYSGMQQPSLSSREGMRTLFFSCITKTLREGFPVLFDRSFIFTLDDPPLIVIKAIKMKLKLANKTLPYDLPETLPEIEYKFRSTHLARFYPQFTCNEVDLIEGVRKMQVEPRIKNITRLVGAAQLDIHTLQLPFAMAGTPPEETMKLCKIMETWPMTELAQVIKDMPRLKCKYMVTVNDPQGLLFSYLAHFFPLPGYPHWTLQADEIEFCVAAGPTHVIADGCETRLDREAFDYNILRTKPTIPERCFVVDMKNTGARGYRTLTRHDDKIVSVPGKLVKMFTPSIRERAYTCISLWKEGPSELVSPVRHAFPETAAWLFPEIANYISSSQRQCFGIYAFVKSQFGATVSSPNSYAKRLREVIEGLVRSLRQGTWERLERSPNLILRAKCEGRRALLKAALSKLQFHFWLFNLLMRGGEMDEACLRMKIQCHLHHNSRQNTYYVCWNYCDKVAYLEIDRLITHNAHLSNQGIWRFFSYWVKLKGDFSKKARYERLGYPLY
jgi:hypothetical protein